MFSSLNNGLLDASNQNLHHLDIHTLIEKPIQEKSNHLFNNQTQRPLVRKSSTWIKKLFSEEMNMEDVDKQINNPNLLCSKIGVLKETKCAFNQQGILNSIPFAEKNLIFSTPEKPNTNTLIKPLQLRANSYVDDVMDEEESTKNVMCVEEEEESRILRNNVSRINSGINNHANGIKISRELKLFFDKPNQLKMIENPKTYKQNYISANTMNYLLTENHDKKFLVIDCRFDYEYQGGHIKGSINIVNKQLLNQLLFTYGEYLLYDDYIESLKTNDVNQIKENLFQFKKCGLKNQIPPIIIFHCEFSQYRAPKIYSAIRDLDRDINADNYPKLYYPELYILEGGYQKFHSTFPKHCVPNMGYTAMQDNQHFNEMETGMAKYKKEWDYVKPKTFVGHFLKKSIDSLNIELHN